MSSYKLSYFNLAGLAEPIRFVLSYGGVDFEDNRIPRENWPQLKSQYPLRQLPILEIDGKTLYQSNAIVRFLGKKFGLLGSGDFEAFEVDAALETIGDLRQLLAKWFWNDNPAQKKATEAETFEKAAFYFAKFEEAAKKNGGYIVGGKITVADIVLAGFRDFFSYLYGKDIIAEYPNLKSLVDKVLAQSGIKAYVAKRPKTDF